jgi:hypothetical protein
LDPIFEGIGFEELKCKKFCNDYFFGVGFASKLTRKIWEGFLKKKNFMGKIGIVSARY